MSRFTILQRPWRFTSSIFRGQWGWIQPRSRGLCRHACAAPLAEPLEPRQLLSGAMLTAMAAFNGSHGDGPKAAAVHGNRNYFMPLPTKVTPIPPDVAPVITGSTLPAKVVRGAKVRGAVTVSLSLSSAAFVHGNATFRLYLSTDGAIDSSSTLLTTLHHGIKLELGQIVALKVPVKSLPATLADGTYTLLAQVSDASGTASTTTGPSIQVAAPFRSLSASFLTVTPMVPGKDATLSVIVDNNGNVATTGAAIINIGLSNNGQTETTTLKTLAHELVIKAGSFTILRLHFKVPKFETGNVVPFFSITQNGVHASETGSSPPIRIAGPV